MSSVVTQPESQATASGSHTVGGAMAAHNAAEAANAIAAR
jgi:hypothetical protein